ncbi:uncharacterized protein LOC119165385 isoform X3 [Rhipicephalus microplus]|uniref:uncharacterized protein LOC119165385 isoform X3 n=1 Tax=Rhipicephalus microplus TaxID=6941 RepID=UPI003F6D8040
MMPRVISAICILWVVGVSGAARSTQLKPYNAKCAARFPVSETRNCRPVKYFYNSKSGICEPTCQQDAPFSARNECALTCRSTLVCFIRTQRQRCHGRPRFIVFRFNVYKRKCYAKKGCSYNGNNFPTLQECMNTCGAGAGSIKVSGGDEEGGSSSEHQVRQQAALSQLLLLTPVNLARPFRPELPSIGKYPRSLQLPKEKPILRGVPPTFPEQSPAPPTNTKIQSEVQLRDPRCAVRISNTTRSCNTSKLYFDQNTHLCKATCSELAPFESRSECNSICRSAVVCFDKRQLEPCKTNAKGIAFYFDALKGKCYARSGCSYRGNNFPTIQECKNTCTPYAGYGGVTKVINASALGLNNITPTQPVNKEAALAPSFVPGADKEPPVAEQGASLSTTAGLVRTPTVVRSPSVSDTAITPLISHKDPLCQISHLKFASSNCTHHYYYFHQASRLCKPTCSETAPFAARSACDKICRSAIVCFHHIQEEDCELRHKATVFSFDAKKGRCITKTGCSNEGNNFPTLQECVLICAAYTGFQRVIHIGATKHNSSTREGPPKLLPPKRHTTEELPNRGLVLNVSGNVPAVSSDTRLMLVQPHQDQRCTITVTNAKLASCQTYMYYFDSQTHLCNPTCSNWAPFRSRRECVGICRSVLVCFVKRTQSMCSGDKNITVYYYDPRNGRCIAGKSCTYVGNNFPTLDECRRTCGACRRTMPSGDMKQVYQPRHMRMYYNGNKGDL